jgi:hypothetical protein
VYQVEKIIDKRYFNGRVEYKVKWKNYSMKQCTWEPIKHFTGALEMVNQYEADIHEKRKEVSRSKSKEKKLKNLKKVPIKSLKRTRLRKAEEESDRDNIMSNSETETEKEKPQEKITDLAYDKKTKKIKFLIAVKKPGQKKFSKPAWVGEVEIRKRCP